MKNIPIKKLGIIAVTIVLILFLVNRNALLNKEKENIAIDEYNFSQLDKIKPLLEAIPANAKKFYTLKDFNTLYHGDIQPMKNCYYVSNDNGNEKYIFAFNLESKKYRELYLRSFYAYPWYNLPFERFCIWYCYDNNMRQVLNTLSHPCQN